MGTDRGGTSWDVARARGDVARERRVGERRARAVGRRTNERTNEVNEGEPREDTEIGHGINRNRNRRRGRAEGCSRRC